MKIFQISGEELIVFSIENTEPVLISNNSSFDSDFTGVDIEGAIILDYDSYFNMTNRNKIFIKYPFLERITNCFSPQEAMGAYIRQQFPDFENQETYSVVDYSLGKSIIYNIAFDEKKYYYKDRIDSSEIVKSTERILGINSQQLIDFEKFLFTNDADGNRYGKIIKTSLTKYQEGYNDYNDIFEILDLPKWANVKMENLLNLSRYFHAYFKNNFIITGWLGFFFTDNSEEHIGLEKIYGVKYLIENYHNFYPNIKDSVLLKIFCYPDWIEVPVFEPLCDYHNYMTPQSLSIIDTGTIEVHRGRDALTIKTGETLEPIKIAISLDGNHNLILVVGNEIRLIYE